MLEIGLNGSVFGTLEPCLNPIGWVLGPTIRTHFGVDMWNNFAQVCENLGPMAQSIGPMGEGINHCLTRHAVGCIPVVVVECFACAID